MRLGAAAGNADNTTDDDDDSMPLPSGASYDDGNKSGNCSSSSSDGSLNGQYAPGPRQRWRFSQLAIAIDLLSCQQGK